MSSAGFCSSLCAAVWLTAIIIPSLSSSSSDSWVASNNPRAAALLSSNACSASLRSVISFRITTLPTFSPLGSWKGAVLSCTSSWSPFFVSRLVSKNSVSSPAVSIFWMTDLVSASSSGGTKSIFLPKSSSRDQPKVFSNAGLTNIALPSKSYTTTDSGSRSNNMRCRSSLSSKRA